MTNSVEEIFYKLQEWLNVKFATYGNLQNTFSGHLYDPIMYDYIFFKKNSIQTLVYTSLFELPLFKMIVFPTLNSTIEVKWFLKYWFLTVMGPNFSSLWFRVSQLIRSRANKVVKKGKLLNLGPPKASVCLIMKQSHQQYTFVILEHGSNSTPTFLHNVGYILN